MRDGLLLLDPYHDWYCKVLFLDFSLDVVCFELTDDDDDDGVKGTEQESWLTWFAKMQSVLCLERMRTNIRRSI